MSEKIFAPDYSMDEKEPTWYNFPRDAAYRKRLFPQFTRDEHPAKANVFLVQECARYVSEPDETVMDIMAGTGTLMVAALIGRKVMLIELENKFQSLIMRHINDLSKYDEYASTMVNLLPGDCSKILPIPGIADHVIFSPPYAGIFKKKELDKFSAETLGEGIVDYSNDPNNVGNLNEFLYHQKMRSIYGKVFDSLPSGGTLTIIIKDHMDAGNRVYLGQRAQEDCIGIGFAAYQWFKWRPPGSAYLAVHRLHGLEVVNDEDIIIVRKP